MDFLVVIDLPFPFAENGQQGLPDIVELIHDFLPLVDE